VVVLVVLGVVVLAAGSAAAYLVVDGDGSPSAAPPSPRSADPTTTSTMSAPPSTTTAPTTTAPPSTTTSAPAEEDPEPDPLTDPTATIAPGDEGPAVVALQERLAELGYWMPEPDGQYGPATAHAVTAFQKVEGLGRDGVAGPETRARLADAARPAAADPSLPGRAMEVDLERQVAFVLTDGRVDWVLDVSTGKAATPTRAGRFTIDRQIDGLRISDLGELWRPKYFDGGIAFHGSPSIPAYPASHGCVRLQDAVIDWLWDAGMAPIGTPVYVH
jgi:peptidoglycan hydrolase-like protein with peptidoglycan-binding domain